MPELFCKDCRFWEPLDDRLSTGLCRRHAPRLVEGLCCPPENPGEMPETCAIWPKTDGGADWCGEAEPAK